MDKEIAMKISISSSELEQLFERFDRLGDYTCEHENWFPTVQELEDTVVQNYIRLAEKRASPGTPSEAKRCVMIMKKYIVFLLWLDETGAAGADTASKRFVRDFLRQNLVVI